MNRFAAPVDAATRVSAAFDGRQEGNLAQRVRTIYELAGLAGVGQLPPFFEAPAEHRGPVNAAEHL